MINVMKKWMEGEINNFIKVWISVYISLSYCYFAGKIVPKGKLRLLTLLPVISLFLALPLNLHTMHLGGMTAFFIAWLSNFKLLMFAFGIGPLSHPSLSLLHFLAIGSLPIKIQQNPSQKTHFKENPSSNGYFKENPPSNGHFQENPSSNGHYKETPSPKNSKQGLKSPLNYATKALLVALFVRVYDYIEYIHPSIISFIFILHIYFFLEVAMTAIAAMARALLGIGLESPFNEPYLSTSLQDFWGKRWNIMVSRILRPTVYDPALRLSARILGRQLAPLPAVLATFMVSAIMHELIFYYLGRVRPTWMVTWFFLLHGVCLVAEIAIKKAVNGRWRLPRVISGPLAVVFVLTTGLWLFLPELMKCKADVRALEEYAAVGAFMKDVGHILKTQYLNVAKA